MARENAKQLISDLRKAVVCAMSGGPGDCEPENEIDVDAVLRRADLYLGRKPVPPMKIEPISLADIFYGPNRSFKEPADG